MKCCCSRTKGTCKKIIEVIRIFSIGKFSTKLYYNGKGYKGSVATGVLTIILALLFSFYTVKVFSDIFDRTNYSLDMFSYEIKSLYAFKLGNETSEFRYIMTD